MKIKKVIYSILFAIIILLLSQNKVEASLNLDNLDFDVKINSDGSMNVTETWDIYISETNTLFKTFETDSSKYSNITDVKVKEITDGKNIEFTQIDEEMYHVTKNCYYGLINSNGSFEIAWGVGLDNSTDTRKYEISYKVNDVIAKYNDYAELYWKFIGEDFEISADIIKGKITLPENVENIEYILVWGHTEDLNGTIYATSLNEIEFDLTNYSGNSYVEVRSLFPRDMIIYANRNYSTNIYDDVIEEETIWAEEANERREAKEKREFIIYIILMIVLGGSVIGLIIETIKNIKGFQNMEPKYKPSIKYEYFREIPYENATPAEALFITSNCSNTYFSSSFSANILDLCLKKYISLELLEKKTKFSQGVIKIILNEKNNIDLKDDEKITLDFLKEVAGTKKEITTKDITKYLEKRQTRVSRLDTTLKNVIEKYEKEEEKYNEQNVKKCGDYIGYSVLNFVGIVPLVFILMIFITSENIKYIIWLSIIIFCLLIINGIIFAIRSTKANILTQKGVDEKNKWNGFKKYMEEYSLLDEKEVPELAIWEKYLVFATAFGISEKVLKQLKVVYPQIADIDSSIYSTCTYIHIMNSVDIGSCVNSSVYSAVGSSGSGSGGGFSGGGGGGRWPEVVVEVDKIC